jgi:hypothetical protein
MSKAARKFTPGNNSNASRMIYYISQLNAHKINNNYLNCTCIPEKIDKKFPGSDSVSYRISNNERVSQLVQTSLGGSIQYGNFYLGEPLNVNYLGRIEGMSGGSGSPPVNRF